MSATVVLLVPYTEHGIPSGNYDGSSLEFTSDSVKAVGYYRGRSGISTVIYRVESFIGDITIEATLDADPATATWVPVADFGDGSSDSSSTDIYPENVLGNYAWMRAKITRFETGIIDKVTVTY